MFAWTAFDITTTNPPLPRRHRDLDEIEFSTFSSRRVVSCIKRRTQERARNPAPSTSSRLQQLPVGNFPIPRLPLLNARSILRRASKRDFSTCAFLSLTFALSVFLFYARIYRRICRVKSSVFLGASAFRDQRILKWRKTRFPISLVAISRSIFPSVRVLAAGSFSSFFFLPYFPHSLRCNMAVEYL